MKSRKSSLTLNSFEDLKSLLEKRGLPLPKGRRSSIPDQSKKVSPQLEEKLFAAAMEGVRPIKKDKVVGQRAPFKLPEPSRNKEDAEVLEKLTNLVRYGFGFNVSETPEYIEGTGYNIPSSVAKRLHQGDYSIQAHMDLHGLRADDAKEVFEEFLNSAITRGKRGVLIIHGRGLSSPSEPILKNKVREWLTRGPWRKWVIAYSSARKCDGGAGATYVLLRQRPVSKRLKRKRATKKV
jgi:DNA-nicking Smr family endonuclease